MFFLIGKVYYVFLVEVIEKIFEVYLYLLIFEVDFIECGIVMLSIILILELNRLNLDIYVMIYCGDLFVWYFELVININFIFDNFEVLVGFVDFCCVEYNNIVYW